MINNLYDPTAVSEIMARIEKLTPASRGQWGKMNVAQMLAHCNISLETAMGKNVLPPAFFLGRLIGKMMRAGALSEKPFGKGAPSDKSYVFEAGLDFDEQKIKVKASLQAFMQDGPAGCTTHPHPFFGHFTPGEWAVFQWKHMDHHLRQFGV